MKKIISILMMFIISLSFVGRSFGNTKMYNQFSTNMKYEKSIENSNNQEIKNLNFEKDIYTFYHLYKYKWQDTDKLYKSFSTGIGFRNATDTWYIGKKDGIFSDYVEFSIVENEKSKKYLNEYIRIIEELILKEKEIKLSIIGYITLYTVVPFFVKSFISTTVSPAIYIPAMIYMGYDSVAKDFEELDKLKWEANGRYDMMQDLMIKQIEKKIQ